MKPMLKDFSNLLLVVLCDYGECGGEHIKPLVSMETKGAAGGDPAWERWSGSTDLSGSPSFGALDSLKVLYSGDFA